MKPSFVAAVWNGKNVAFSPFRFLDTSLTASGSVYMNEQRKLGSDQGGLNVHKWVLLRTL